MWPQKWYKSGAKVSEHPFSLQPDRSVDRDADDGGGSLLDHAMVLYGSSLSDSNAHTHDDLPTLLAGGGGGALRGGRHLRYPDGTPMTNLFLTLLDRLGVHRERVGDSTGRIAHLSAL